MIKSHKVENKHILKRNADKAITEIKVRFLIYIKKKGFFFV